MAEDVHVNIPTGNGERVELKVGNKSLGITSRDLLPVLLMIGVFIGGYLVAQNITARQDRGLEQLLKLLELLRTNQNEMVALLHENRETTGGKLEALATLVQTHRLSLAEEIRGQNTLLFAQTTELRQAVDAQTTELTRRLSILNHNMDRPSAERLPLDVAPESLPQLPRQR